MINTLFERLQDIKKVILVAGNHDFYLEFLGPVIRFPEIIIYLKDDYWSDDNIQIYGTPLCKKFGNWAFMLPEREQENIFNKFLGFEEDDRLKIILSHDSPYGCSDVIIGEEGHIGNLAITKLVERTKPDLLLHGHLHSSEHEAEYLGKTEVRCVSVLGEDYEPAYKPYYFLGFKGDWTSKMSSFLSFPY